MKRDPLLVDQDARTLRATPLKGSKEVHHTFQFVQHHVQFYGQTLGLKRAGRKGFSFDVEFEKQSEAWDAYRNCKIPGMDLQWADDNIMDKSAPVPTVVSYRPPRFDYPIGSNVPSLPVPWNNPFCIEWDEMADPSDYAQHNPKRPRGIITAPRAQSSVQRQPPNPLTPCNVPYWPKFPRKQR